MTLTGKQRALLKQLASKHKVMFQVGHNGLTNIVIKNITDYLTKHEVGRLTVLKTAPESIEMIEEKLQQSDITVVGKIGKVLSLYKPNADLKDRIKLS